jgi:hypothetical protein
MKPTRIKWIALASVALLASACKSQSVSDTPAELPAEETATAQTEALPRCSTMATARLPC